MRELTLADCVVTLNCEPEHIPYQGNCSAIDEKTDRRQERWIARQLDNGNQWAWCCVTVTVYWHGFEGSDSLCGCSYRSEKDFRAGPYFEDMCSEALDELNAKVKEAAEAIAGLS